MSAPTAPKKPRSTAKKAPAATRTAPEADKPAGKALAALAKAGQTPPEGSFELSAKAAVDLATGQPLVMLAIGDQSASLAPGAAMQLGANLLLASSRALTEAQVVQMLRGEADLTGEDLAALLQQLRETQIGPVEPATQG